MKPQNECTMDNLVLTALFIGHYLETFRQFVSSDQPEMVR